MGTCIVAAAGALPVHVPGLHVFSRVVGVAAAALLIGRHLIGERTAVDLAWMLSTSGTVGGLFTARPSRS